MPSRNRVKLGVTAEVRVAVVWYFREEPGCPGGRRQPFYCDPSRVGAFAVASDELATGGDGALFRLFVTLSMYQALRDVVIMRQQQSLPRASMRVVADAAFVKRSIARHECPVLRSADAFEEGCDVAKVAEIVDCGRHPGRACHVKDATVVFNRMGDMGKLPTSAWLRLWKDGGVREVLAEVCRDEALPTRRAALLVERFARVHRVGRKLATMFVSALSTPALAPLGISWYEGMFNTHSCGQLHATGQMVGGHAILCKGVNVRDRTFLLHNSWGSSWGRAGDAKISWDEMDKLLHEQGEAVIPLVRKIL